MRGTDPFVRALHDSLDKLIDAAPIAVIESQIMLSLDQYAKKLNVDRCAAYARLGQLVWDQAQDEPQ